MALKSARDSCRFHMFEIKYPDCFMEKKSENVQQNLQILWNFHTFNLSVFSQKYSWVENELLRAVCKHTISYITNAII